jgi:DNA-binding NarL/FixJ family response regulator
VRILIVDDHALFREGLRLILGRLGGDISFHEGSTADIALQQATTAPDLILLDLNLPGLKGADCVHLFLATYPGCPIILLSGMDNPDAAQAGLAAGAIGFIHKSSTATEMLATIQSAMAGTWSHPATTSITGPDQEMHIPTLTQRQTEVLARLCAGRTNKEIATDLDLSDNTVRVHLAGIFRALEVRSRTQAIIAAKRLGLV